MGCWEFLNTAEDEASNGRKSSVFKRLTRRFSRVPTENPTNGANAVAVFADRQQASGDGAQATKEKRSSIFRLSKTSGAAQKNRPDDHSGSPEELVDSGASPSDIANAYVENGKADLARDSLESALENFSFALSYSSPRTQYVALFYISKVKLAQAKRLSKGSRGKVREEALQNAEKAMKLVDRFKLEGKIVDELKDLSADIEQLTFKVAV